MAYHLIVLGYSKKKKIGVWENFTKLFNISRIILIFLRFKGRVQCYALLRSKMHNICEVTMQVNV